MLPCRRESPCERSPARMGIKDGDRPSSSSRLLCKNHPMHQQRSRRKRLLLQPGSGSGCARGEEADDGETQRCSNTAAPPHQLKSGHFLHPTPGAATLLPIGEGAMGHHVDPLPGKFSELAVPPEPTASPFLLLSFFLSVLSPLCLL